MSKKKAYYTIQNLDDGNILVYIGHFRDFDGNYKWVTLEPKQYTNEEDFLNNNKIKKDKFYLVKTSFLDFTTNEGISHLKEKEYMEANMDLFKEIQSGKSFLIPKSINNMSERTFIAMNVLLKLLSEKEELITDTITHSVQITDALFKELSKKKEDE